MSKYNIDALAALEQAATKGGWGVHPRFKGVVQHEDFTICSTRSMQDGRRDAGELEREQLANAALIAAMRNALPHILNDLREALELLESIKWNGCPPSANSHLEWRCPDCRGDNHQGHATGCRLNNLLTRLRGE